MLNGRFHVLHDAIRSQSLTEMFKGFAFAIHGATGEINHFGKSSSPTLMKPSLCNCCFLVLDKDYRGVEITHGTKICHSTLKRFACRLFHQKPAIASSSLQTAPGFPASHRPPTHRCTVPPAICTIKSRSSSRLRQKNGRSRQTPIYHG